MEAEEEEEGLNGGQKQSEGAIAAISRCFDWKDLSQERSGTALVATTSPHAEFPDQMNGRLFRRSGNGGGTKAAIMNHGRLVMDLSFCD
jgi:hypothetical protein